MSRPDGIALAMDARPLLDPTTAQCVDGLGREIDTTYNTFGEPLTVTAPNPSAVQGYNFRAPFNLSDWG